MRESSIQGEWGLENLDGLARRHNNSKQLSPGHLDVSFDGLALQCAL